MSQQRHRYATRRTTGMSQHYVTVRNETRRDVTKKTRTIVFVASCLTRTRQPRNHEHKGLTNGR